MKNKNNNTASIFSILRGEFIADYNNQKYIPFLLMLVILILINISISFRAENLLKKANYLETEVAELRLSYITTKSDLMHMYRRSVIEELVYDIGLQTSLHPPKIIDKYSE